MPIEMQRAIGLFPDHPTAEAALVQLRDSGFDMDKVSIVSKKAETDEMQGATVSSSGDGKIASAAGKGATAGGIGGGAVGLIGSLGILAIPGVGPVAELGVILANTVFAGAIGAVGGGLVGALVGWGLPEDQAKYYSDRVNSSGNYLVLVEGTADTLRTAENILQNNRISDWRTFSAASASSNTSPGTTVPIDPTAHPDTPLSPTSDRTIL